MRVLPFAVETTAVKVRSEYMGTKRKRPTRKSKDLAVRDEQSEDAYHHE